MSVLYIVLPLALLLAVAAVSAFIWAVRTGQMDDLQTPALRMLHDDVATDLPKTNQPQTAIAGQATSDTARAEPLPVSDARPPSQQDASANPYERKHRALLASTLAETPHARSRASSIDQECERQSDVGESELDGQANGRKAVR